MVNNIIHQITGPLKDELIKKCMDSWKGISNYGFELKIWDDPLINAFVKAHYPFALDAIVNARNHAEAADIARYLIIFHFGGYYIDWDIELIDHKQFIELTSLYNKGFLVIDSYNATIASECFSAIKNEKFLLLLVNDIIEIYNLKQRDLLFTPQFSGPYRMRDSLKKHRNTRQELIEVNDIFKYNFREIKTKKNQNKSSPLLHYWTHSWI